MKILMANNFKIICFVIKGEEYVKGYVQYPFFVHFSVL